MEKTQKPKVFVLLGRAGGGKTEAGKYFTKKSGLNVPVIPLADIMRAWAKKGHSMAMQCVASIRQGKYFSGEWSVQILHEFIQQNPRQFRNGFIIDGFPRRLQDIPAFEAFLARRGLSMGG